MIEHEHGVQVKLTETKFETLLDCVAALGFIESTVMLELRKKLLNTSVIEGKAVVELVTNYHELGQSLLESDPNPESRLGLNILLIALYSGRQNAEISAAYEIAVLHAITEASYIEPGIAQLLRSTLWH